MKNYKAHYSLSWSCPFYKVIAQRPTFLILKINSVTMGVSLKGRGPFIAGRRLDYYKLIISTSTKGFS
jgi:hypothetical protein